jgi:hypothetical protein
MLKIQIFLCFLVAVMLAVGGCGKEEPSTTIIKGTVTDRSTGKPIEGAVVTLGFVTSTSVQGSLRETTDLRTVTTDAEGRFSHMHNHYSYTSGCSVTKDGYVTNLNLGIEKGKENILDITMLPRDAFLKVVFVNQDGQQTPLYFLMMSVLVNREGNGFKAFYHLPKNNPLSLSQGGEHTELFLFPKDEIKVYWDFFNFYATAEKAMSQDKVQLVANDTVEYKIIY